MNLFLETTYPNPNQKTTTFYFTLKYNEHKEPLPEAKTCTTKDTLKKEVNTPMQLNSVVYLNLRKKQEK